MNLYSEYLGIMETYSDKRVTHLPLVSSIFPIVGILAVYFWFIKWKGPEMMKDRPAYNLDRIMIVYNAFQVVLSITVALIVLPVVPLNMVCSEYEFKEPSNLWIASYMYFLLKIVDLLDTVFFVLRKKTSQITFLHVYHHSMMIFCAWMAVTFFASGHSAYMSFVNSIVHTAMYAYYIISIFNKSAKNSAGWKKHITQLQLIQFVFILSAFIPMLFMPSCKYPKGLAWFVVSQNGIYITLFTNFYYHNYIKKKALN